MPKLAGHREHGAATRTAPHTQRSVQAMVNSRGESAREYMATRWFGRTLSSARGGSSPTRRVAAELAAARSVSWKSVDGTATADLHQASHRRDCWRVRCSSAQQSPRRLKKTTPAWPLQSASRLHRKSVDANCDDDLQRASPRCEHSPSVAELFNSLKGPAPRRKKRPARPCRPSAIPFE